MKTTNSLFTAFAVLLMLFSSVSVLAQMKPIPKYMTSTTLHWNSDIDMEAWKAVEKEYLEKVTKKNQYILSSSYYFHQLEPDNHVVILVNVYDSWEAIEKAAERNTELEKEGWSNEKHLKDFKKKKRSFFERNHSDEIYSVLPFTKPLESASKNMVCYVRTNHMVFPEDGDLKEVKELLDENVDKLVNQTNLIKGYYTYRHAWGADGSEMKEAFFLDSMDDLEKMQQGYDDLFNKAWPQGHLRKKHMALKDKYFSKTREDAIYEFIAELSKY
ncbi:hypothetical protein [Tamlana sp. I1]|uniref:hypothetical protein n=1 Tax=Tamlana sp. I1 TaxID=2762061 RepID=UPI00188F30CF|nr:hypothetical protein [Tamlana sp. I1]